MWLKYRRKEQYKALVSERLGWVFCDIILLQFVNGIGFSGEVFSELPLNIFIAMPSTT